MRYDTGVRGDGDGWVRCGLGHQHWGRYGAAGLLLHDGAGERVLLQHRALWSHHGGTWGIPGGARDSAETAAQAALREADEEVGLEPALVRLTGALVDDHGGWTYETVVGVLDGAAPAPAVTARTAETLDVRWVARLEVVHLPLHPGFAATWPRLLAFDDPEVTRPRTP